MNAAQPVRAIVVDDEPLSRSNVISLLKRHADVEIVAECGNGTESVAAIRRFNPDLVFLDVEMPECDGFDVLEMLGARTPPAIVFVTAYDKYALQAFEAGALDYLLKPFDSARFDRALARAKERIAYERSARPARDTLAIKNLGGVTFLKIGQIDWVEASDYYSRIHTEGKSYLLRRSMSDLEDDLRPFSFCRIHRSAIVNLDRVAGMALNENGDHDVLLRDGTKLRLSRTYRAALRSFLDTRQI